MSSLRTNEEDTDWKTMSIKDNPQWALFWPVPCFAPINHFRSKSKQCGDVRNQSFESSHRQVRGEEGQAEQGDPWPWLRLQRNCWHRSKKGSKWRATQFRAATSLARHKREIFPTSVSGKRTACTEGLGDKDDVTDLQPSWIILSDWHVFN